jgi:hypothetical protein
MQAGRKRKKDLAKEKLIDIQVPRIKKKSIDIKIIGYCMDKGDKIPYPIFESERLFYKGKFFKTADEARRNCK